MQLNEDEPQQESISFDQSGSSAHYLRAHGPDITLSVEDILAGRFVDSSSSSSEASSNYAITQVQQPTLFFQLESMAFQKLALPPLSSLPQFPISLERIDISALPRSLTARKNVCVDNILDTNPLAIVPFQPSLHAVLIQLWAAAKTDSPSTHQESPMAGFCSSVQVALEVQVVEQANHNSDTVMAEP